MDERELHAVLTTLIPDREFQNVSKSDMQEEIVHWLLSRGMSVRHNFLLYEDEEGEEDTKAEHSTTKEPEKVEPKPKQLWLLNKHSDKCDCCVRSIVEPSAINGQYLCNRPITCSYAFKMDTKSEKHGTAAEKLLAAQNRLFLNDRPHQVFSDIPRLRLMPMAPPMTPMIKIGGFSKMPPSPTQGMQQGMPDAGIANGSIAYATTSRCIWNVSTASSDNCSSSAASFNDRFDDEFTNAATSASIYLICSNGFKKKSVEKYFEISYLLIMFCCAGSGSSPPKYSSSTTTYPARPGVAYRTSPLREHKKVNETHGFGTSKVMSSTNTIVNQPRRLDRGKPTIVISDADKPKNEAWSERSNESDLIDPEVEEEQQAEPEKKSTSQSGASKKEENSHRFSDSHSIQSNPAQKKNGSDSELALFDGILAMERFGQVNFGALSQVLGWIQRLNANLPNSVRQPAPIAGRSSVQVVEGQCRKTVMRMITTAVKKSRSQRVWSIRLAEFCRQNFCHFDRISQKKHKKAEYDGFLFVKQKLSKPKGAKQVLEL
uniref:Uncharacterized protein n=1 Tax=Ditylenchus dipsaci TaxID=166011 RepID=A0A915CUD4_9BILA